jgi:hypothetical protein
VREKRDLAKSSAHEKVYLGIAVVVTAVWTLATVVQVVDPVRVVPTYANVIMGIVATAFFGASVIAGRKNGKNGNGGA